MATERELDVFQTVRIPVRIITAIDQMAYETSRSRAGMVRHLLIEAVGSTRQSQREPVICVLCQIGEHANCMKGQPHPDTKVIMECDCAHR